MTLSDRIFRPFETLVQPLDLPLTPLPDKGPIHLVWHFAKMFRGVLLTVSVLSVISALIGIVVVWALAFIVDGIVDHGAQQFIQQNILLLCGFGLLIAVIDPLISFIDDCFASQSVHIPLPAAMRWHAHKSVENQDVAFFEDVYAGQVASRIEQVTGSVHQQLALAIQSIPQFAIQFFGSIALLAVLAWPLAIPVIVWIIVTALISWKVVPIFIKRSERVAEATSRATGAMTDVYSNITMVKSFSAEASEGDAIQEVITDTVDTLHRESRFRILTFTAIKVGNALLAISMFATAIVGMARGFVSVGDFVAAATIIRSLFNSSYAFIQLGHQV